MADNHNQGRLKHLLSLPLEIRLMIYKFIFPKDAVCEIRRSPMRMRCLLNNSQPVVHNTWTIVNHDVCEGSCLHAQCRRAIERAIRSDTYLGNQLLIGSPHYPCPRSLKRNQLNLSFLLTCHQIYQEARTLPYSQSIFHTREVGSFANFTYCLKSWQVCSLAHLAIDITTRHGMETHGAEWNETFSLISLSFLGLSTISLHVTLAWTDVCLKNRFWDGGLLELDRLALKGFRLTIWGLTAEEPQIFFTYSAGSLPTEEAQSHILSSLDELSSPNDRPISFRCARDALRQQYKPQVSSEEKELLFFRLAPNSFPLYVRNLIHILPRRNMTYAEIRHEDRDQRENVYHYAYNNEDVDQSRPIFGFQFSDSMKDNTEYIARGLSRLQQARRRLQEARPLAISRKPTRSWSLQQQSINRNNARLGLYEGAAGRLEIGGQWRRQLMEETYSPLMESFPLPVKYVGFEIICVDCPILTEE